ncbi:MAG: hypothetical protein SVR08_07355 [Spirochaetota bacterium]|nr:hypothetical protein [Spirochaetota bacterium]
MNKKKEYTTPKLHSEKIEIGVFGKYGGCPWQPPNNNYNWCRCGN